MTKKILFVVAGLLVSLGVNAQVKVDRGYDNGEQRTERVKTQRKGSQMSIKYGMKLSLDCSTMSNNMQFDPGFGMGAGYGGGLVANFHWGQRTANSLPGTGWFGLQLEALGSYRTVKTNGGDIHMNYIQVPVMFKVYPLAALSFEVGPEFNYLLKTTPKDITVDGATVNLGHCRGFNMGLGIGAEYEIWRGITAGARYSFGFTDMAKNLKWKNNGNIQISLGYMY